MARTRLSPFTPVAALFLLAGCVFAAAGAGAGAAIHLSDRGVESVVPASVDRTFDASRQAFQELGITAGRQTSERDGATERRELEGSTTDREITVIIKAEGDGAHVEIVARKSAVTWDKDFARRIMEKIVAAAR
jgi:hypothetical protein